MEKKIKCEYCDRTFISKNSESKHRIRVHGQKTQNLFIECQENNCNAKFANLGSLRSHLEENHGYAELNECEEIEFTSLAGFIDWLTAEERESRVRFITARGGKKGATCTSAQYNCSRSGVYKSISSENRKLIASKKVGYHCTAQVLVKQYDDHVYVKYFRNHYKHDFKSKYVLQSIRRSISGDSNCCIPKRKPVASYPKDKGDSSDDILDIGPEAYYSIEEADNNGDTQGKKCVASVSEVNGDIPNCGTQEKRRMVSLLKGKGDSNSGTQKKMPVAFVPVEKGSNSTELVKPNRQNGEETFESMAINKLQDIGNGLKEINKSLQKIETATKANNSYKKVIITLLERLIGDDMEDENIV